MNAALVLHPGREPSCRRTVVSGSDLGAKMISEADIHRLLRSAKLHAQASLALLKQRDMTIEQAGSQVRASKRAIARSRKNLRSDDQN